MLLQHTCALTDLTWKMEVTRHSLNAAFTWLEFGM